MKHGIKTGLILIVLVTALILCASGVWCREAPEPRPAPTPENQGVPTTSPAEEQSPAPVPSASPALSPSASPEPSPSPEATPAERSEFEQIYEKMKMVNEGLKDYSAVVKMNMKAKYSVLEIPLNLDGNYYFKAPDRHRIKVNKAPNFLAQYPQVFGWSLPDTKDFTGKVKGEENGCKILRLVPIMGMGDLLKIEIWVDKETWRYPRQVYYYRSGGKIELNVTYKQVEGYYLFDRCNGTFDFPKNRLKASGDATYEQYEINKGIPDSFFEEETKK